MNMNENKKSLYDRFQDLWCLVPFTVLIVIIRIIFERYCFTPLGKWFNLVENNKKLVAHNTSLEALYNETRQCKNLSSIAKKLDLSERQVERWWRLRRNQDKPSTLVKFTENMWMATFYLWNVVFGIYVLWDKAWFWDLDLIIEETEESAPSDIWWYYMVSSAFYWSLTITQFWDVRRKDFWQMFVHHIATITMLTLSWLVNVYRIGSIVLLLHDAADVLLQCGKAAKRARLPAVNATYTCFAVTWLLTRLVIYPYCVLVRTTSRSIELNKLSHHILNAMLWFVLVLNVIWTLEIFRVVYESRRSGQEPRDMRSSSSDTEAENCKEKILRNPT